MGGGGGGVLPMIAYTGRLRLPERDVRFFRLQIYERVGISPADV